MTCEHVRAQLTAYLGGELDDTSASSLRGHLRLCEACRAEADAHARLVDALGGLPPPEPPPSMWAGVTARLAQAEIEDAKRSRVALWWQRVRPQLVPAAGLLAAAAVAGLWIAHRRGPDVNDTAPSVASVGANSAQPALAPKVVPLPAPSADPITVTDVALDLAGDDARADAAYKQATDELYADASDLRATWTPTQARSFDAHVAVLRTAASHAPAGPARERAWQALVDYLQRAVVGVRVAEAE